MRGGWGRDVKGGHVDGVVGNGGEEENNGHADDDDGDELRAESNADADALDEEGAECEGRAMRSRGSDVLEHLHEKHRQKQDQA